ncbi:MAG: hypothetical protein HY915_02090 [Desulfovibrio sp.]|nr:hypothetical protein [Desulfovibrio sp.]
MVFWEAIPVCTGLTTKPWAEEAGGKVLDQSFSAENHHQSELILRFRVPWRLAHSLDRGHFVTSNAIRYAALAEDDNM